MSEVQRMKKQRFRRKMRSKSKIRGTSERPRLCVFRSSKHISAQIIDDSTGKTMVSASTLDKEGRDSIKNGGNKEAAAKIGTELAARAKEKEISKVVFDRNGFLYHGRVKTLADAAREAGLDF